MTSPSVWLTCNSRSGISKDASSREVAEGAGCVPLVGSRSEESGATECVVGWMVDEVVGEADAAVPSQSRRGVSSTLAEVARRAAARSRRLWRLWRLISSFLCLSAQRVFLSSTACLKSEPFFAFLCCFRFTSSPDGTSEDGRETLCAARDMVVDLYSIMVFAAASDPRKRKSLTRADRMIAIGTEIW